MKYKVVFQGQLENNWSVAQARDALGKTVNLPSNILDKIFSISTSASQNITLKKNLSNEQADTYIGLLKECGMRANKISAAPAPSQSLAIQEESTQVCPKCRFEQPQSEFSDICENCGIYMSKYQVQKEIPTISRSIKAEPVATSSSSAKTAVIALLALIVCYMIFKKWPIADDDGITGLPSVPVTAYKFPDAPDSFEKMLKPDYINVISISDPTCKPCQSMVQNDKRLLSVRTDVAITRIEIDRFDTAFAI